MLARNLKPSIFPENHASSLLNYTPPFFFHLLIYIKIFFKREEEEEEEEEINKKREKRKHRNHTDIFLCLCFSRFYISSFFSLFLFSLS